MIDIVEIAEDFVLSGKSQNGHGILKGNILAVYYAMGLSKAQIKKFRRYRMIPAAFFLWLRAASICPDIKIPCGGKKPEEAFRIIGANNLSGDAIARLNEIFMIKLAIGKECRIEINRFTGGQERIWRYLIGEHLRVKELQLPLWNRDQGRMGHLGRLEKKNEKECSQKL